MDKFDVGDVVKYGNVISRIVSKCNTFTIYSKYSRYLLENNKHNMFFIKENELTIVKPRNKLNKSFWKSFEETGTIIEVGECDKELSKLDRIREVVDYELEPTTKTVQISKKQLLELIKQILEEK